MKKALCLLLALVLSSTAAFASILPPSSTLPYAVEMPSLGTVLLRDAAQDVTYEDGTRVLTYTNVTAKEFDAFSEYLGESGCALTDSVIDSRMFTATITKGDKNFTMQYDLLSMECVLSYPAGTKVEDSISDATTPERFVKLYEQALNGNTRAAWCMISPYDRAEYLNDDYDTFRIEYEKSIKDYYSKDYKFKLRYIIYEQTSSYKKDENDDNSTGVGNVIFEYEMMSDEETEINTMSSQIKKIDGKYYVVDFWF